MDRRYWKILLVEDEPYFAKEITTVLSKHYQLTGFQDESGETIAPRTYGEAIKCIETQHPDLAIIDLKLQSFGSGDKIARYLNRYYPIPIIYLTNYTNPDSEYNKRARKTVYHHLVSKISVLNNPQVLLDYVNMTIEDITESTRTGAFDPLEIHRGYCLIREAGDNRHKAYVVFPTDVVYLQVNHKSCDAYLNRKIQGTPQDDFYKLPVSANISQTISALGKEYFLKISQSVAINLQFLDYIDEQEQCVVMKSAINNGSGNWEESKVSLPYSEKLMKKHMRAMAVKRKI